MVRKVKYCECGCGQEIIFKPHHSYYPVRFIYGHNNKGKNHPMYGKHHTKEARQKMSKVKKGKNHPMYGKYHTKETKYKMSKVKKGKNHPNWKGGKIEVICQYCKKPFKAKPYEIRIGKGKYCSVECYRLAKTGKNHPMYGKHHTKEARQKMSKALKGKIFSEEHKQKIGKTHRGKNHFNWRGGISFKPYPPSFNQQRKERIRVRDNFICQLCGVPELECNRRLSVHHIDYDKNNCRHNNLISLCRSCNSRVNYNRNKWTEHFQRKVAQSYG